MDLKAKLIQTGHNLGRLHGAKKIDDEAYNLLMARNEETLAMLHEKACAKAEPTNERAVLPINIVTHRALQMKIEKLEAENKLLAFMVENGLGEQDMLNDITYPHEL
jgi:hypothetical protein